MTSRQVLATIAITFFAGGCGLFPRATPHPGVPCEQVYSEDDCQAMIELATTSIGKSADDVDAIAITPNPTGYGSTSGAAPPIRLRLTMNDGSTLDTLICGGVSREEVCSAQPHTSVE